MSTTIIIILQIIIFFYHKESRFKLLINPCCYSSYELSIRGIPNKSSICEFEGRIAKLRAEYEKERQEINNLIEHHNRMLSLLEQAQEYKNLSDKGELSPAEELKMSMIKTALHENGIYSSADVDKLKHDTESMGKRIAALKDKLESCRQRYDVYSDIAKTYEEILQGDYISKLVEEERQRREQVSKRHTKRL